jgi:multiple sugar transport system substrate-binding protein
MSVRKLLAGALAGTALCLGAAGFSGGAQAWSLEEAAKPYAGATIKCVGDGYAPFVAYQKLATEQFTPMTGITVEWEVGDVGAALRQKMTADAINQTGVYDCVELPSLDVGLWAAQGFAKPMHEFLADPALHDPTFDPMTAYVPQTLEFSSMYDGKVFGLPYHFIPRFMVVRHDIYSCTDEQAAFKAKFNYDLPEKPATWEQFKDVASFFTRKAGENLCGKPLENDFYGTAVSMKRHWATQYDFELFLNGMGGVMFDEKGDVAFDSDIGVKAMEYWLSLLPFVPPGYLEYTWDNTYADMCQGNIYTYPTWGDTTPYLEDASDAGCPKIAGKMAYYPVPGTNQTGAEGQAWLIPASSKNKEATFLFLQWLASFEVQKECQKIGCTSPRRDVWFEKDFDGTGAVEITRWLIENNKVIARDHPPAMPEISTILIDSVHAAGRGELSAADAMKQAGEKSREALAAQ